LLGRGIVASFFKRPLSSNLWNEYSRCPVCMANGNSCRIVIVAKMKRDVTRLAPSPTGALHLGNARTFLINWLLARQREWKIVLRIEDLDGPRVKRGADRGLIEDLAWLGLD